VEQRERERKGERAGERDERKLELDGEGMGG